MHILITGASGMLGSLIARRLHDSGHTVSALSRTPVTDPLFSASYQWDPKHQTMDPQAFNGVDAVIHLAGAGIADRKWTSSRKAELLESRVQSTSFLQNRLDTLPNAVHTVVAASAVGYYGNTGARLVAETDPPGQGFLAETCVKWESALQTLGNDCRRLVVFRIGFVIDRLGGALPVMAKPVNWFVGAPYGGGGQFISWIDSRDLSRLFEHAVMHPDMKGVFNAVAPAAVTNKDFVKALGSALHRPVWPIGIPALLLKSMLGEQSSLVLDGQRVSADKLSTCGFRFHYPDLPASLKHHLN